MTVRSYGRAAALAGTMAALIAGALALWLSAAPTSVAASANQDQGTAVTVVDETISWGSAGDCTQAMGTADFGSVLPGAFGLEQFPFNGCVTSNASGWNVSASATTLDRAGGGYSIPAGLLQFGTTAFSGSASDATAPCYEALCTLEAPQTVLSNGAVGTGGFVYGYSLGVPDNAPAGVYGGTVTFTASN